LRLQCLIKLGFETLQNFGDIGAGLSGRQLFHSSDAAFRQPALICIAKAGPDVVLYQTARACQFAC
jgi:hypothetical protein